METAVLRPKVYKTLEEKRSAFLNAVNMRKKWEAEMRKRVEVFDSLKS